MKRYRRDPAAILPDAWAYDPRRPIEEQLLADVAARVKAAGGRLWHLRDSRGQPGMTGLPDCLILIGSRLYAVELKGPSGEVTDGQRAALVEFSRIKRVSAHIVRSEGDRLADSLTITGLLNS